MNGRNSKALSSFFQKGKLLQAFAFLLYLSSVTALYAPDPPDLTNGGELDLGEDVIPGDSSNPNLAPDPIKLPKPKPVPVPTPNPVPPEKPSPNPKPILVIIVIAGVIIIMTYAQYRREKECMPIVEKFTARYSPNGVMVTKDSGECYLSVGDPGSQSSDAGVKYYARVRLSHKRCAGTLMFIRNVAVEAEMAPGPNTRSMRERLSSKGAYVLDNPANGNIYTSIVECSGVGPHEIHDEDTPRMSLNPSELLSRKDLFREFLVWKPRRGMLSRFRFTLQELKWEWSGSTTSCAPKEAECTEPSGDYELGWKLTDHTLAGSNNGFPSTQRPALSPTVRDLQWEVVE